MKRRNFIKNTGTAISLPLLLNGFKLSAIPSSTLFNAVNETDRVLVLIRQDGGNDSLNTFLPLDQYDGLSAVRSNILIPSNQTLTLSDTIGLHPTMGGIKNLFDEGRMGLIQSVGYPNQNRSHFRSTDIWTSGSPAEEYWQTGWLGRYLENMHPNFPENYPNTDFPDPFAITMGNIVSETCQGTNVNFSTTVQDPFSATPLTEGSGIVPDTPYGEELTFLRTAISQANAYSEVITGAAESGNNIATYPDDNTLAQQLKNVALLISGGLKTKIYIVSQGGFDTHANQVDTSDVTVGEHASLLQTLSDSVSTFQQDLQELGLEDRVITMTFTEFGRRIRSNLSLGTDHGTAAGMMLFGSCVNPAILGDNPEIAADAGVGDGIPMQYDFRDVYGSILKDWFGVEESTIKAMLFEEFTPLPIISCTTVDNTTIIEEAPVDLHCYPNPCTTNFIARFSSEGEWAKMSIFNNIGGEVKVVFNRPITAGQHEVNISLRDMPKGTYFCRLQMGVRQKTMRIVKM